MNTDFEELSEHDTEQAKRVSEFNTNGNSALEHEITNERSNSLVTWLGVAFVIAAVSIIIVLAFH